MLPRIVILATGGTIAGHAADRARSMEYVSGALGANELLAAVPGLLSRAHIECETVASIGSEHMTDGIWLSLAVAVTRQLSRDDVAGVVVLHGTDTMEETAYFLNLVVHTEKPVVMTGAMRPANAVSADGNANLLNSVILAATPEAGGKGVLVCLNDSIGAARDVVKTNTTNLSAFASPVFGELGIIAGGVPVFYRSPVRLHGMASEFSVDTLAELPRVEIIYGHAGQRPELVDAAVGFGARGLVHAGVGMGNVHNDVIGALERAAKSGVPVVCSSRTGSGMVLPNGKLSRHGFITADTLNPQKARVLLRLALTKTTDAPTIQRYFDIY